MKLSCVRSLSNRTNFGATKMLSSIKSAIKRQVVDGLQGDAEIYYGRFKGTSDFWPLFVKNVLRPTRFVEKARFGQIAFVPEFMKVGKPYPDAFDKHIEEAKLTKHFEELKKIGVSIIPEYFPSEQCDAMIAYLGLASAFLEEADAYRGVDKLVRLNDLTKSFWLNMPLVALLGKYLQRFPYARIYPRVSVANPNFNSMPTREIESLEKVTLNVGWHYDTVNLVQFHVLLNDVEFDGSCMQVLGGTHRHHHLRLSSDDYWLSDEYVKNRNYPVINCVGKKGTAYVFDSNAYHRFRAVKGKPRAFLQCGFTPGNNILMQCTEVAESLSEDENALKGLDPAQREILSGVYPVTPFGGFRYVGGCFTHDHARL
jgi:hypothetical protein